MTTFHFRLERVLRWRQAKLELEQFALSRIAADRTRWDKLLAKLENSRAQAETLLRSSCPVTGNELEALARYKEHLGRERQVALDRRRECERKMEQQLARLLAARREYRLLEKLRQVRRAEWETAVNREFEALAAESYLARWEPRPRPEPAP
jgi:flagellar export protein FliJ